MAMSRPTSAGRASFQIDYQSQEPNKILGHPLLLELYSSSPLTVVTFLLNEDPVSEQIRERTLTLMLNIDLVRNIQFVEQELENLPMTWLKYNVNLFRLPTIIYYSRTGEIDRLSYPNADRYEERVRFYRGQWFKYTITSPLQIGRSDFLSFRAEGKTIIRSSKVVLLINGDQATSWCQQSRRSMDIMRCHGITFLPYDVLQHEGMFKAFQDLARYKIAFPHIYLNGQMIGGISALNHLLSKKTLKEVFELKHNDTLVNYLPNYFIPAFPLSAVQSRQNRKSRASASSAGGPSASGN